MLVGHDGLPVLVFLFPWREGHDGLDLHEPVWATEVNEALARVLQVVLVLHHADAVGLQENEKNENPMKICSIKGIRILCACVLYRYSYRCGQYASRPQFQELSAVDENCVFDRSRMNPVTVRLFDLQRGKLK